MPNGYSISEMQRTPGPHPVLLIGIVICVAPVIGNIWKWKLPGWLYGVGVVVILIGAGLSIVDR